MALLIWLLLAQSIPILATSKVFHLVTELKTWHEAQSYCREKFTDLASIESTEDQERVVNMIASSSHPQVYIGLYDDVDSWRWSLDNTPLNQNIVFQRHPPKPNCAYILDGQIYDGNCDESRFPVCHDESSGAYLAGPYPMTWLAAQSFCRASHTDLVSVRDDLEMQAVKDLISLAQNQTQNLTVPAPIRNKRGTLTESMTTVASTTSKSSVESSTSTVASSTSTVASSTSTSTVASSTSTVASSTSTSTSTSVAPSAGWWIGLFRDGWKWSDQSNSSFRNWSTDEPSQGIEACACATSLQWNDVPCSTPFPFICSGPVVTRKVVKVVLKTNGSVDLNDPMVKGTIMEHVEQQLRGQQIPLEVKLNWREHLNGDVFNRTGGDI